MPGESRKRVLFVTYGGGHAVMVLPVIRDMRARLPEVEIDVLALTAAQPYLRRHGESFLSYRDLLLPEDADALRHGRRLAETLHAPHAGIPYEESVAYLGLSYADLERRLGVKAAADLYAAHERRAFRPLSIMERLFERVRPDVVVTTNSPRTEQAARELAWNRGIPVVVLSDLIGTHSFDIRANALCVSSKIAADGYRLRPNVHAETLHVTGNPAMDNIAGAMQMERAVQFKRSFPDLDPRQKYATTAEQDLWYSADGKFHAWTRDDITGNLERLYAASREHELVLMVRPHPSLNPDVYSEWVSKKPGGKVCLAAKMPIHEVLVCSDIVIGNNSTVMLDALYLGKPLVVVYYPGSSTLLPFDTLGMAYRAEMADPATLSSGLRSALSATAQNAAHRAAFQSAFPPPPAAPRVTDVIRGYL